MGFLLNPSLAASDSNKLSVSFWSRIPSTQTIAAGKQAGIFESIEAIPGGYQSNWVSLIANSSAKFRFAGELVNKDRPRTPGSFPSPDPVTYADAVDLFWDLGNVINTDTWYHICFSFDAGSDLLQFAPSGDSTVRILLNGTNAIPSTGGSGTINHDALYSDSVLKLSGSGLRLGSKECGHPWVDVGQAHNQRDLIIDMFDFQLWYGTYIDWNVAENFSKVVTISSGVGTPASTLGAANFFGEQTILFHGKASDGSYYVNRGSGDPFTITGTASDFTPGPSYTP